MFIPTKYILLYFINVLESFIPFIILSTSKFTASILLGTHILLNGSSEVLQLPLHLSRVVINGY